MDKKGLQAPVQLDLTEATEHACTLGKEKPPLSSANLSELFLWIMWYEVVRSTPGSAFYF